MSTFVICPRVQHAVLQYLDTNPKIITQLMRIRTTRGCYNQAPKTKRKRGPSPSRWAKLVPARAPALGNRNYDTIPWLLPARINFGIPVCIYMIVTWVVPPAAKLWLSLPMPLLPTAPLPPSCPLSIAPVPSISPLVVAIVHFRGRDKAYSA